MLELHKRRVISFDFELKNFAIETPGCRYVRHVFHDKAKFWIVVHCKTLLIDVRTTDMAFSKILLANLEEGIGATKPGYA
jgi:hypothetical protein